MFGVLLILQGSWGGVANPILQQKPIKYLIVHHFDSQEYKNIVYSFWSTVNIFYISKRFNFIGQIIFLHFISTLKQLFNPLFPKTIIKKQLNMTNKQNKTKFLQLKILRKCDDVFT